MNSNKQKNIGTASSRFYQGYTIRNHGYYPPDKCLWWEAVNNETGNADFHAKRLKDIIPMINETVEVLKEKPIERRKLQAGKKTKLIARK